MNIPREPEQRDRQSWTPGDAEYSLTREQVKSIIFRYIFVYYNRIRISSVNPGGLSPAAYREWAGSTAAAA